MFNQAETFEGGKHVTDECVFKPSQASKKKEDIVAYLTYKKQSNAYTCKIQKT